MPRAVPRALAERRRERLRALFDALGAARGSKVTQREFAAVISREQGTLAAILGGHRALGGDVMLAIVQAFGLPSDYFDAALSPDPRPFARAVVGRMGPMTSPSTGPRGVTSTVAPSAPSTSLSYGSADPALAATLAVLCPDRAVAMALEALSQRVGILDGDQWARHTIAAQSANDRGVLVAWYDTALEEERTRSATVSRSLKSLPTGEGAVPKQPKSSKPRE